MLKKIIFVLILILVIFAIPATILLVRQTQELRKSASTGTGTTEVTLSPGSGNIAIDQTFPVLVQFNTKGAQIDTAQIVINVDGVSVNSLTTEDISGLTWQIKTKTDTASGAQIRLLASTSMGGATYSNNSLTTLATINLRASQAGTAQINFDTTLSRLLLAGVDILLTPTNGSYTISASAGTPTPSPTPGGATATSTPTPTPGRNSPTPTPTGGIGGPTATPRPALVCWSTCSVTSECPSGLVCQNVNGVNRCIKSSCPSSTTCTCTSATATPQSVITATATPLTSPSEVVSGNISTTILLMIGGLMMVLLSVVPRFL